MIEIWQDSYLLANGEMISLAGGKGNSAETMDLGLALLREREVSLDVNLTSNTVLLYPDISRHPFPRLEEAGLTLTVNSDDPALFNTTMNREFELLDEIFGYPRQKIARIAHNAFGVCGAPPELKHSLMAEFERWAANYPGA